MKIKQVMFLIGSALAMLIFCSVTFDPENNSQTGRQILPLKLGDTWVFRHTFYDTTGEVTRDIYDTLSVSTDTVVSGDTWYKFFAHSGNLYTNKQDGLWIMRTGRNSISPTLLYKFPTNVGETWNTPYFNSTILQVSVLEVDISLTVPQGTYECIEYRTSYNSMPQEDDYFCPGVGFVEDDYYSFTNSGRAYKSGHRELVGFTLK